MPGTKQRPVEAQVRQLVLASADRTFEALIDPKDIGQWMFGPNIRDEKIISLKSDPRPGGRFSFVVERRSERLDHTGRYERFTPGVELAFTWIVNGPPSNGDIVHIALKPMMIGTEVNLTHDLPPAWAEAKPKVEAAWAKMLGALARHLAKPAA
ncbi:MAG: hypothetical protein RL291_1424 [Pseudomonadota bacterium]|jgi:uncharacterized protein YndB with AHSA1/START domain